MPLKPKIIWIDGVGCNGCSHSFFNLPYFETLFSQIELLYHPILDTPDFKIQPCDILIIEGGVRENFPKFNTTLLTIITKLFEKAKQIIAVGSCSSFGGIFGEGIIFNKEEKGRFFKYKNRVINLSGCPIHPEWLGYVLEMIINNKKILLDKFNRPKEIYGYTSHTGCIEMNILNGKLMLLSLD